MQTKDSLFFFKLAIIKISVTVMILFFTIALPTNAKPNNDEQIPNLDIYGINPGLLNTYDVIKKGTSFNLILLDEVFTKKAKVGESVNFLIPNEQNLNLQTTGILAKSSKGKRFSIPSSLELSTNKIILDNGQEVYCSASTPLISGIHPPHVNTSSLNLARFVTSLSIASSPATLGASLGINFLVSGILSAYQNGFSDFVWGGLNGSGFSFLERMFRKQPEIFLASGTSIPFTLKEDLKINKGINKEKMEILNTSKEESIKIIERLLTWGDLSGALELSVKTGQKEVYDNLLRKISNQESVKEN